MYKCANYNLNMKIVKCLCARYLSLMCFLGQYAYQLEPTNEYLLISVRPAWITLQEILSKGKEECDRVWAQTKGKTLDYYQ